MDVVAEETAATAEPESSSDSSNAPNDIYGPDAPVSHGIPLGESSEEPERSIFTPQGPAMIETPNPAMLPEGETDASTDETGD
jgi:hypothetical protein